MPERPVVVAARTAFHDGPVPVMPWAALGDDVELLTPDLRGRGTAAGWGPPYGMARHAADLAGLLDERNVTEPVVVAGHSMGGFVAVVMAHLFPDRVRSLVLVDGGLPVVPAAAPGRGDFKCNGRHYRLTSILWCAPHPARPASVSPRAFRAGCARPRAPPPAGVRPTRRPLDETPLEATRTARGATLRDNTAG